MQRIIKEEPQVFERLAADSTNFNEIVSINFGSNDFQDYSTLLAIKILA